MFEQQTTEQHFDAIIVGAGFGGIGAAVQLKRLGIENFVILDRLDDLGGTWYVNHHPGLQCDVPPTTCSYFFEPNPNWSALFATGAEIKQYADDVADKYDVRRHIRFSAAVDGARWDEESNLWQVSLADGATVIAEYHASPVDPDERGGHVTLQHPAMREVTARLWQHDVIPDYRDPGGLRLGLSPLSTSFEEVYRGLDATRMVLREVLAERAGLA